MPAGRPTEYKSEYAAKVTAYLKSCTDKLEGAGTFAKLKVKLPTTDGFAKFLGVARSSLYEWEKEHPEFSDALELIRNEQQERLLNNGLSGDYNSTIAKLVLSANHGMREKSEIDHNNPDGNLKTIIINKHGSSDKPAAEADGSMGSV